MSFCFFMFSHFGTFQFPTYYPGSYSAKQMEKQNKTKSVIKTILEAVSQNDGQWASLSFL